MASLSAVAVGFGVAAAGLVGAVLSRLLAEEVKAWMPRVVDALIRGAVARLPEDQKERRKEEWHSHVNDIPGDLGKFVTAVGFVIASRRLADKELPYLKVDEGAKVRTLLTFFAIRVGIHYDYIRPDCQSYRGQANSNIDRAVLNDMPSGRCQIRGAYATT